MPNTLVFTRDIMYMYNAIASIYAMPILSVYPPVRSSHECCGKTAESIIEILSF